MHTLPPTLTGPFGLRFALRGRRVAFLVLVAAVWSLWAPPTLPALAGGLFGLAVLAFFYRVGASARGWCHLLDSLAPVGGVVALVAGVDAAPAGQFAAAAVGCFLAPIWILFPFVIPTFSLETARREAERWATEDAADPNPISSIRLAAGTARNRRSARFVVRRAEGGWFHQEIQPAFSFRVRTRACDVPPLPHAPLVALWSAPTTAHGILAWRAKLGTA